ncbi:P-loop containing nucleoside triphosphate hydrolase protein, partial [Anaeromyces robustus]
MLDIPEKTRNDNEVHNILEYKYKHNNTGSNSNSNSNSNSSSYSSSNDSNNNNNNNKIEQQIPSIEFKNVSFSYKEGEPSILKNINFTIPTHSIVALVGKSGCGKSTIASLIMGEHNNYEGEIFIEGINRKNISEKSCMQYITRISHDNFLFAGTLWDNLYMGFQKEVRRTIDITTQEGRDKLTEKMIQALREVRIYNFVLASGGLYMKIEPNASNLSGGQRQRIALARAILHDSEIYIFDEATSNIDVESEKKIMKAIYKLAETKTIIIISHRLANIIKANKIIMMKEGEIMEQGTHDELI